MPDAAKPKERKWTQSERPAPLDHHLSDDGWTLHYEKNREVPRWTITGSDSVAHHGERSYNAQLAADQIDAALDWANGVLDEPPVPVT